MVSKIEKEVVGKYLKSLFNKSISRQDYKVFDDVRYVFLPTEILKREYNFSPFKQRTLLNELQEEGILCVKLGQGRARYFSFEEKTKFQLISLREDIIKKVERLSDIDKLEQILSVLNGG